MTLTLDRLIEAIERVDLAFRGAFHPQPEDGVPPLEDGRAAGTLVLVGVVGRVQWPAFERSAEAQDGHPHPLDRYSQRRLQGLAGQCHGRALDPSAGPPWWPFQRWALRAEAVHVSPLGLLIHPTFGLWHSYRGALVLAERIALPAKVAVPSPCATCADKPCLAACPVDAFSARGLDPARCASHLRAPAGETCLRGCLARRACPHGQQHAQGPQQAAFHLKAFLRARPL